jgi:hypothetical protein
MVGLKRLCSGASRDWLHNRRLDLEKASIFKKPANLTHDLDSLQENFTRLRVGNQIKVTLPVSHFDIGNSMPLIR